MNCITRAWKIDMLPHETLFLIFNSDSPPGSELQRARGPLSCLYRVCACLLRDVCSLSLAMQHSSSTWLDMTSLSGCRMVSIADHYSAPLLRDAPTSDERDGNLWLSGNDVLPKIFVVFYYLCYLFVILCPLQMKSYEAVTVSHLSV